MIVFGSFSLKTELSSSSPCSIIEKYRFHILSILCEFVTKFPLSTRQEDDPGLKLSVRRLTFLYIFRSSFLPFNNLTSSHFCFFCSHVFHLKWHFSFFLFSLQFFENNSSFSRRHILLHMHRDTNNRTIETIFNHNLPRAVLTSYKNFPPINYQMWV